MKRRVYLTLAGTGIAATAAGCLGGDDDTSADDSTGDENSSDPGEDTDSGGGDGSDSGGDDGSDSGGDDGSDTDGGSDEDVPETESLLGWSDSLDWLSQGTPEPDGYGTLSGEYGVFSWWGYSDRITEEGGRVPAASSSEQSTAAAEFLLAQDEQEAFDVLEAEFDSNGNTRTQYVMVDALLAETWADGDDLFTALADAHPGSERADFYRQLVADSDPVGIIHRQAYYRSMVVRLYQFHGSQAQPKPFVTRWQEQEQRTESGDAVVELPQNASAVRFVDDVSAARDIVGDDSGKQVGGLGANPAAEVPALEQFRLVYDDEVPAVSGLGGNDAALSEARDNGLNTGPAVASVAQDRPLLGNAENSPLETDQERLDFLYKTTPSFTKTFERVPGATIEGSLPESAASHDLLDFTAGDPLVVSVSIDPPNGQEFTYSQTVTLDETLAFEATVPYATAGYDEYGPAEGYTDVQAQATGPYTVETIRVFDEEESEFVWFGADVDVTEGQVLGAEDPTVTAEFEERTQEFDLDFGGGDDGDDGNDSDNGT